MVSFDLIIMRNLLLLCSFMLCQPPAVGAAGCLKFQLLHLVPALATGQELDPHYQWSGLDSKTLSFRERGRSFVGLESESKFRACHCALQRIPQLRWEIQVQFMAAKVSRESRIRKKPKHMSTQNTWNSTPVVRASKTKIKWHLA